MTADRGIHQFVVGLTYGDAITHHALAIRRTLRAWGIPSEIVAENVGDEFAGIGRAPREINDFLKPHDIIMYHYSIHSTIHDIIQQCSNPIILIYHNITPSRFFVPYSTRYTALLDRGRQELVDFKNRTVHAIADSEYNRQELETIGFKKTNVFPIYFERQLYKRPVNQVIYRIFKDGYRNILSVGRIVPQKKIEDLIKMFAFYRRRLNNRARLILVGEYRGFERYFHRLLSLREQLKLGEVYFTGMVPLNELLAYYKVADVFISASEHEGFCVPLLESMFFRCPIIAKACGATPETLGSSGILFDDTDPAIMAELVHKVIEDNSLKEQLKRLCSINLDRFNRNNNSQLLQAIISEQGFDV